MIVILEQSSTYEIFFFIYIELIRIIRLRRIGLGDYIKVNYSVLYVFPIYPIIFVSFEKKTNLNYILFYLFLLFLKRNVVYVN